MKDKACQREKLRCIQKESISGSKALLSKVIIIAFIYILLFDPTIGSAAIQYDAGAWDTTKNSYEKQILNLMQNGIAYLYISKSKTQEMRR